MNTIKIDCKNVLMIAHRGLSGIEMENTIAAFIAAGNKSYYGTECDIHLTKDNVFVVCHDPNTERISPVNKIIKTSTYQDLINLSLYDLNSLETRPHLRIPTLKEYISVSSKYNKKSIIEIKPELTRSEIKSLIEEIDSYNYLSNVTFISFNYQNLIEIRKIDKNIKLQYLVGIYSNEIIDMCVKINADVDIHYKSLSKINVENFHNHNIKVNAWTVDDPTIALLLVSWNVDFITTNILE